MKAAVRKADWGTVLAFAVVVAFGIAHAWGGDVLGAAFLGGIASLALFGRAANVDSLVVTRAYRLLFIGVGIATVVGAVLRDSGAWQATGVLVGGALVAVGCRATLWRADEGRDGGANGDRAD